MKTIYLVRHCKAEGQEPEANLTTEGKEQAANLVHFFEEKKIDRIIASPFERAIQSVVPLATSRKIKIEVDERLAERILSDNPLENWLEELKQTYLDLDYCLEGGESSRDAMERAVACVEEYVQVPDENILMVTHGNLLSLLLKVYDDRFGFKEWQELSNPDVFCMIFNGKMVQEMKRIWKDYN